MRNIAVYCVNYHSYDSLGRYLSSDDEAAAQAEDGLNLAVFVGDNTEQSQTVDYEPAHFALHVVPTGRNMGYFGAVRLLMEQHSPQNYDYTIISNVDVLLSADFFTTLVSMPAESDLGWLAPQIYSHLEGRDRNPKILRRYAKRKLQVLRALFAVPPLYNLYTHTAYKQKKFVHHEAGDIYAGHGSFIILTQAYFRCCGIIDYPVFLFCEEIYLGEMCQKHSLRVRYVPTLKVTDAEHASTGTFRRSRYCRYNYQALSYILSTYY